VTTGIPFEYSPIPPLRIHGGYMERVLDMNTHICQRTVEAAKPPASGYIILFDDRIEGFGLRVTAAGTKSFVLNYRLPAASLDVILRR
jgi:hypothetical protein